MLTPADMPTGYVLVDSTPDRVREVAVGSTGYFGWVEARFTR